MLYVSFRLVHLLSVALWSLLAPVPSFRESPVILKECQMAPICQLTSNDCNCILIHLLLAVSTPLCISLFPCLSLPGHFCQLKYPVSSEYFRNPQAERCCANKPTFPPLFSSAISNPTAKRCDGHPTTYTS